MALKGILSVLVREFPWASNTLLVTTILYGVPLLPKLFPGTMVKTVPLEEGVLVNMGTQVVKDGPICS